MFSFRVSEHLYDRNTRDASLAMSTSILEALPGKLDIKRHSVSILYILRKAVTVYDSAVFSLSATVHYLLMYGETKTK